MPSINRNSSQTDEYHVSIQILQYEFLGPIRLSEWGPPMEKVVYIILYRDKDKFHMLYAGDCKKTEKADYFIKNSGFKCWMENAGREENLYLAIFPMFEEDDSSRCRVLDRVIAGYKPICNNLNLG